LILGIEFLVVISKAGFFLSWLWVNTLERAGITFDRCSVVNTVGGPVSIGLGIKIFLSIIKHEVNVTFAQAITTFVSAKMDIVNWFPLAPASLLSFREEILFETETSMFASHVSVTGFSLSSSNLPVSHLFERVEILMGYGIGSETIVHSSLGAPAFGVSTSLTVHFALEWILPVDLSNFSMFIETEIGEMLSTLDKRVLSSVSECFLEIGVIPEIHLRLVVSEVFGTVRVTAFIGTDVEIMVSTFTSNISIPLSITGNIGI